MPDITPIPTPLSHSAPQLITRITCRPNKFGLADATFSVEMSSAPESDTHKKGWRWSFPRRVSMALILALHLIHFGRQVRRLVADGGCFLVSALAVLTAFAASLYTTRSTWIGNERLLPADQRAGGRLTQAPACHTGWQRIDPARRGVGRLWSRRPCHHPAGRDHLDGAETATCASPARNAQPSHLARHSSMATAIRRHWCRVVAVTGGWRQWKSATLSIVGFFVG